MQAERAVPMPGRLAVRSIGLRTLLVALPAVVMVPLLVLAAYLLHLLSDATRRYDAELFQAGARTLALAVEREIGAAARLLRLLAEAPAATREGEALADFHGIARRVTAPEYGIQSVALIDRQGRWLLETDRPFSAALADAPLRPLREHHRRALETGSPAVSELVGNAAAGQLAVWVVVPVGDAVPAARLLAARVAMPALERLIASAQVSFGPVAVLVDASGRIVARSHEASRWVGQSIDPALLRAVRSRSSGTTGHVADDGARSTWAWHRLSGTDAPDWLPGWAVLLELPETVRAAPLRSTWETLAIAGLAMLSLALTALWLLQRRLLRSVAAIGQSSMRALEGKPPEYRPSRIRQFDALQRTLHAAAGASYAARVQAERANRAKDEFLAMLSHELRNPLSPIVNMTRLVARTEPLTERGKLAMDVIARQLGQLTRLVDDLLDASRVTKGKIRLRPEPVDVVEIAQRAAETTTAGFAGRAPRIRVTIGQDAGRLVGDPMRLKQVLENLLHNAAKFSRASDAAIELDVDGDADWVTMRVRDHGVGIAPENLSRVFELFTQAHATLERSDGGLGIGLALVRSLVQMHGGTVVADSAGPGRGAAFTVRLPRRPPPTAPVSRDADASLSDGMQRPDAPRRRVTDEPA